MTYRKKLIEVALPLEAINVASAREKSIRHGHPSTLHLWWARRPLAACRAVLFASLVDDPDSDPQFRKPDGTPDEEAAGAKRAELFTLIEDLVRWENSNNPVVINAARAEIARCVASRKIELGELAKDTVIYAPPSSTPVNPSLTLRVSAGEHGAPDTNPKRKRGPARPERKQPAENPAAAPLRVGQPHPKGPVSGEGVTAWEVLLRKARPEVVNAFLAEQAPPVLDPFCGGGSIPLEAQRLGLRAYASDLNQVPDPLLGLVPHPLPVVPHVLGQAAGAFPDRRRLLAGGLLLPFGVHRRPAGELRRNLDQCLRDQHRHRPDVEPYVGEELTVIAWLWARTVASPSPVYQGIHVPLVRGFWLSKKTAKMAWIEPIVDRQRRTYRFVVRTGTPSSDERKAIEAGTKLGRGCKFRCLLSDEPIAEGHIKTAGLRGELRETLLAIVAEGARGRVYLPAEAMPAVAVERPSDLRGIDAPLANDPRNLWCLGYGLDTFDKLFTPRQLVALTTFSDLVQEARERVLADARAAWPDSTSLRDLNALRGSGFLTAEDAENAEPLPSGADLVNPSLANGGTGPTAYADAVATYLAFGASRSADFWCTIATWSPAPKNELVGHAFTKQALPMTWDFAESSPFSGSGGNFFGNLQFVAKVLAASPSSSVGHVAQLDVVSTLPDIQSPVISTDPPYYDNIGYADLSDFFYVWLRRSLIRVYPALFATLLTPKSQELIASPYRHDGNRDEAQSFFETGLGKAFLRIRDTQTALFPFTVYYAFKQAESDQDDVDSSGVAVASTGWETMLGGLIESGFSVCGTWPMRTERGARSVGIGTNALASSIILVCRPRPEDAPLATRKEFLAALHAELPEALRNLQRGNIAPVDLAQAAIGPGMAVFTRYSKVLESDGRPMSVRTALGLINQSLDEVLAEQEGEFDADTRWALAWFEQFGMDEGPFGVAETLSKAKNTAVGGLVEAGVITARAGKVRLVRRSDLPEGWNPATDRRLTVWETTQHLIRTLDQQGEAAAAALLNQLGGLAEIARDLAYRLYTLCERKKWAEEALAYNGLVIAWPELSKLAMAQRSASRETQAEMF